MSIKELEQKLAELDAEIKEKSRRERVAKIREMEAGSVSENFKRESIQPKPTDLQQKFQDLRTGLNQIFLEREVIVAGLLSCLVAGSTGKNAIIYGPHGTAKSALIRQICQSINGANFFDRLLQMAQSPDEILGQPSIKAIKDEDILRRNIENRLPNAHIGFLDEIFRCNPTTLNALLRIANEHEFENPDVQQTPLLFLVGAANFPPQDQRERENLAAFIDRFVFQPWVDYLRYRPNRRKFIGRIFNSTQNKIELPQLSIDDIYEARKQTAQISDGGMIESLLDIQTAFEKGGFSIGDRRLEDISQLLQGYAWLEGDTELNIEHIHDLLPYCVPGCDSKQAKKILDDVAPSYLGRVKALMDAANVEVGNFSQAKANGEEISKKSESVLTALIAIQNKIEQIFDESPEKLAKSLLKYRRQIKEKITEVQSESFI